jgi:hypothetical protein
MRKIARRTYLRAFAVATALAAFGIFAQSAFAGGVGGWGG